MVSKTALLALVASVAAVPQGFNYGSTRADGSAYSESDFEGLFKQAQNLPGTSGFSAARLYTMLQGGTADQVISAIPAAIKTKTQLLLGMWVSGDNAFENEMKVFQSALSQYGDQLKDVVVGISVGSEDLYRISPVGLASPNPGPGAGPDDISGWINDVKTAIKGGPLNGVPVGHVDTWPSWTNGSNAKVIEASDFLGVDAYPYWQTQDSNSIDNAQSLFNAAFASTKGVSQGKQVWITETGYPVVGKSSGAAVTGPQNAQRYWQEVGCPNFGKVPTFWYTMIESPTADNPDFSVFNPQTNKPWFDLSCANVQNTTSTTTTSSSGTSSASGTSSSGTSSTGGSSSGSSSSNGTYTSGSPNTPTGTGSNSGSGSSGSSGSGSGSGSGSVGGTTTGAAASSTPLAGSASSFGASIAFVMAMAAAVAAAF